MTTNRVICSLAGRSVSQGPVPPGSRVGHEERVSRRGRAHAARLPDANHPLQAGRGAQKEPER